MWRWWSPHVPLYIASSDPLHGDKLPFLSLRVVLDSSFARAFATVCLCLCVGREEAELISEAYEGQNRDQG